jgi:hypothetical protein
MGTTTAGTSPRGLLRGLRLVCRSAGILEPELFHTHLDSAVLVLSARLERGAVVLPFKTDVPWDHWVVALSARADLVCVQDSAEDELRWLTWGEVVSLWEGPKGKRAPVFGVGL